MIDVGPSTIIDDTEPPQLWFQAVIRDIDTSTYFVDLQFRDINGEIGTLRIERAQISEPSRVIGPLLRAGAVLPDDKKEALSLIGAALRSSPLEQYSITQRGGWHQGAYVSPCETYGGGAGAPRFAGPSAIDPTFGLSRGTSEAWMQGMAEPCQRSAYLTFAICVAFAAPCLDILGEDEGSVFHYHGLSSSGKSLAARSAESMVGRARKTDVPTFDLSDRSMEDLCHSRNDLVIIIDEGGRNTGGPTRSRGRLQKNRVYGWRRAWIDPLATRRDHLRSTKLFMAHFRDLDRRRAVRELIEPTQGR